MGKRLITLISTKGKSTEEIHGALQQNLKKYHRAKTAQHMSGRTKIWIIALAVVLAGSAFYWYDLRPRQIRAGCSRTRYGIPSINAAARAYENCLRDNGLAK